MSKKLLEIHMDGKRTIISDETKEVDQKVLDFAMGVLKHFHDEKEEEELEEEGELEETSEEAELEETREEAKPEIN